MAYKNNSFLIKSSNHYFRRGNALQPSSNNQPKTSNFNHKISHTVAAMWKNSEKRTCGNSCNFNRKNFDINDRKETLRGWGGLQVNVISIYIFVAFRKRYSLLFVVKVSPVIRDLLSSSIRTVRNPLFPLSPKWPSTSLLLPPIQ